RVWDVAALAEVAHRQVGGHWFKGLAFTPDGGRLVTVSNDQTARLWDTGTWREAGGYEWKVGKLASVAVSPDGMRMAAGGSTGKVVVWDVDGGRCGMIVFQAQAGLIASLAFSPDGEHLATADGRCTRLWAAPYRAPSLELAHPVEWGASLAFSPDGQHLAR